MRTQTKPLPPVDFLRLILDYDPATGLFLWKSRPPESFPDTGRGRKWAHGHWATRLAGKPAFCRRMNGVYAGTIGGKTYMAHRVAWAISYGEDDPSKFIDHINGDPTDNRLANLRLVSHAENMRNAKIARNNTSGVCGVFFNNAHQRWSAYINKDGRRRFLGEFEYLADATAARQKAEREMGFHPNHGRPKAGSGAASSGTASPSTISP